MTDPLTPYPHTFTLPTNTPSRFGIVVPSITGSTLHVYTGNGYVSVVTVVVDGNIGTCVGIGGDTNGMVVMGTRSGSLVIVDAVTGTIVNTIPGAHTGSVTDVAVDGALAYTVCDTEPVLIEWDLITGEKKRTVDTGLKGMKSVCVGNGVVCCGAEKVCVVDTVKWKLIKTLPGHATPVTQIIVSPTTSHIYTLAYPDRCVYQYSLTKSSSSDEGVMYQAESSIVGMNMRGDGTYLCGVTETGEACIWSTSTIKKTGKENVKVPDMRVVVTQVDAPDHGIPIRYAMFSGDHVTVAYGSGALNPVFETIKMDQMTVDGGVVTLERDDKTVNGGSGKKKKGKPGKPVNVIGSIEMTNPTLVDPKSNNEPVNNTQTKTDLVKGGVRRPTTLITLQQMLTQAITTNDTKLLEKCFEVTDKNMIMGTVDRLDPTYVITLIDLLVVRLQRKPNRAVNLVEWIRCVVMRHAGYLMSVPACAVRLGTLYRTLDTRQDVMKKMMRLYGRLDLVVGQFEMRKNVSTSAAVVSTGLADGGDGVGEVDDDGVLVYEDEDDEISDDEMSEEEEEEEEEMMEE